jgi:hypothetical protein
MHHHSQPLIYILEDLMRIKNSHRIFEILALKKGTAAR